MKKVLVGITSRNRASILPKAIQSALNQNYLNKEIAIFDDASTDGTALLQHSFPDIKWILSKEPRGLMYARNLFLEVSDAAYFCSLDDDAWFLSENALGIAIEYLDNNKDVAAIGFEILSPDRNKMRHDNIIETVETNRYIGCGHVLRVDIAKNTGMYLSAPGFYGSEEKDLCIRMIDAGYKIIKMKGLYVWHDKTSIARDFHLQHRSNVCNDLVFMWRRTPLMYLVPSFFLKLYKQLAFSIRYKGDSLTMPCLGGIGDFYRALFTGKIKRNPVSVKAFKKYLSFN